MGGDSGSVCRADGHTSSACHPRARCTSRRAVPVVRPVTHTLTDLLATPDAIMALSRADAVRLIIQCGARLAMTETPPAAGRGEAPAVSDTVITPQEAGARVRV